MTSPISSAAGSVQPRLRGSYARDVATLTLEALRLGVVPSADLSAYTVGREIELELVDADLVEAEAQGGAVRAFLGDYGTGKTHLLELAQRRALASGFLAARVTLDPRETAPSHPKRVYRALVRSLCYPDRPFERGLGLLPLLQRALASPVVVERLRVERTSCRTLAARLEAGAHLYLTPALQYLAALDPPPAAGRLARPRSQPAPASRARELLIEWLEGHPTISNRVIDRVLSSTLGRHDPIYSLKDYRPWSRIYGYLLSGLSWLARQVGYRGLALLVDEAEFYALLSPENRAFAETLFKALTFAAVGATAGRKGGDLPFDETELSQGGYGILQSLPTAYDSRSGLYVVFAMTPNPDGVAALEAAVPAERTHELSALCRDSYLELAARVCDFYVSSRADWSAPEAVVKPLGKVVAGLIASGYIENPRQAMKFVIEFLDLVRFRPERVGHVVRALSDRVVF